LHQIECVFIVISRQTIQNLYTVFKLNVFEIHLKTEILVVVYKCMCFHSVHILNMPNHYCGS